jgi:diguanylate cyclase (GGDEF)-like protein
VSTALSPAGTVWAAQQLAEFLAGVSSADDEPAAVRGAVERAAEAFEAEAVALVADGVVVATTGFAHGGVPAASLLEVAEHPSGSLEVPGVGSCKTISVPIEDAKLNRLVVARYGPEEFGSEEVHLARGMGRVLALTTHLLRVLEQERELRERSEQQAEENSRLLVSLRERQRLVECLSSIQNSIVRRKPLDRVLDEIVTGTAELLGDDHVGLRLVDQDDARRTTAVATAGVPPELREATRRGRVGEGVGGRAISEDRLVVIEDYEASPHANPHYAAAGVRSAMAAPVREEGTAVGSLVVASRRAGRSYSKAEQEVLLTFAEHTSLALTDAKTVGDAIHQGLHDALTGLPNRALLLDRLAHALARAARSHSEVAVLFLDLDTFKTVNDSLGHTAGDELLVAVAQRLLGCVRPGDTAARFGGDEFVVLLEDIEAENVPAAAQRILDTLREPFELEQREVFVSASIGIAVGRSEADDLIRNADLALYRAKARGKGGYEVFEPEMHTAIVKRLDLEGDLQRALQRDEFTLHYQPMIKLRTGEIAGVEALVRWRHPKRGMLQPDDFIEIAEESRLILPLGRWVLLEACRRAAEWRSRHRGYPALALGVNLSSAQLAEPSLVDEVSTALEQSGLDPQSLILELTETAFMEDTEAVAARMQKLKGLGVQLAVDDFGTGYSSLQHLRRFPIDVLKIDKSFVDGVGGVSDDSALARAIIDLGGSFQLRVVAEGIESPEQLDRLIELGCDLGQGFHFAKPMPADELDELLARRQGSAQAPGSGPALA